MADDKDEIKVRARVAIKVKARAVIEDTAPDGAEAMAASWQHVIDRPQPFSGYLLEELAKQPRARTREQTRLNFARASRAVAERVRADGEAHP